MKKSAILFLIIGISIYSQSNWIKTGGPDGGFIASIVIKGDTILVGTGYEKALVFFSTNKGVHWQQSKLKLKERVADFVFTNDNAVISANMKNGIYKSYDIINWSKIYTQNFYEFWSVGKDILGNFYAGIDLGKILNSTNNGLSWNFQYNNEFRIYQFANYQDFLIAIGGKRILIKDTLSAWRIALEAPFPYNNYNSFTQDTVGNFYVGAETYPFFLYSSDYGNTWINHDTTGFMEHITLYSLAYNHRLIGGYGPYPFETGGGIVISNDKGYTWNYSNNGFMPNTTVFKVASSGEDTYAGTEKDGFYKSTDYGDSWNPVPGSVTAADVRDITIDSEENIYAAIYGGGLSMSSDKGDTWKRINNGITNANFRAVVSDMNGVIFAGSEQGIFKSTDKGNTWIHTPVGNDFCYRLFGDRENHIYAFTAGTGIYRTTDQGISWIKADTGIATQHIYSFAQDSSGIMYAGAFGSRIFRSTNNGSLWQQVYQGSLSDAVMFNITAAPNGFIYAANYNEGVYRSTDHGDSWDLTRHGLTDWRVKALASDISGVYVSTEYEGLYKTTDNGVNWVKITGTLALTTVNNILIAKDNKMYFATDESVWKKNDSVTSLKNENQLIYNYTLEQNYPNPFNPSTEIKYSIPSAAQVKIKVFDILGREVSILVNEYKEPGAYSITFDASNFSSGVYFYKLEAGSFSLVKKMMLLR